MQQQAQETQARIAQQNAQTDLTRQQAAFLPTQQQAQLQGMTQQPRWDPTSREYIGNMTDKAFENYVKGASAANTTANSKEAIAELNQLAGQGKIKFIKPAVGGGYGGYDASGNLVKVLEGSIDTGQLQKVSSTTQWLSDGAGGFVAAPKTTVSGIAQGSALQQVQSKVPNLAANQTQQGALQQKVPALGAAAANPAPTPVSSPRRITTNAVGVAFDPQTNSYVQETAAEAQSAGHQEFQKITAKESEENRMLGNRLADVGQKMQRYQATLQQPVSETDRGNMAGLMTDLKVDAHGISIPFDRVNTALNSENLQNMSPVAKQRVIAYWNARESLIGYQRVLSGSAKSSEKSMELQLQALPNPSMPEDFTKDAIGQFVENLRIAGQGLPRVRGITSGDDILRGSQPQQVNFNIPKTMGGAQ
jgi:hypothetical protein